MPYHAPVEDMRFALRHLAGVENHVETDIVDAVLEEAARLARDVFAPLNHSGDKEGSRMTAAGVVQTPKGFSQAYDLFHQGGWQGLTCAESYGGQGLPVSLGMAVAEMWMGANLSLSLCPVLTHAAIEAIAAHGSDAQKQTYLPNLVSGTWTGTMHLTEPQAGSDLSAIRTVAVAAGEHYLIKGQKIFISWGEHDLTENIIHLVLARIAGLPEGNDGLGLFIVPKFLVNADGSLGARNDVHAVSVEHKMGIHASPTCVMAYGDAGAGAVGYLVGAAGKGLRNMFTMMNNARINVGLQGVGVAEGAYQHAYAYAQERVQGAALSGASFEKVAIVRHPDVRRMLLTMKAQTESARALTYYAGGYIDRMHADGGDVAAAARVDFLTPLVKAWCTDMGTVTASLGIQVHGGMGYVEETGAAQFMRDARVLEIYEGTNGIQSNDLAFRKVARDSGAEAARFMDEIKSCIAEMKSANHADLPQVAAALDKAVAAVEKTTAWVVDRAKANALSVAASAQPYQRQFSTLAAGYVLAVLALAAHREGQADTKFAARKIKTALFFAQALLPQVHGLTDSVTGGNDVVLLEEVV